MQKGRLTLQKTIPLELKRKCVELRNGGMSMPDIYRSCFAEEHPEMGYETFRHKLKRWMKQALADPETLHSGTYPGFIAHGATVQVDRKGQIVQAWIKEHADDNQLEELIAAIKENTAPIVYERVEDTAVEPEMLEIPLFDQHFPIDDHIGVFVELSRIIESRLWEEINIIVGQDLFHNDDMRGRTSSGRPIEKVDMVKAWELARIFFSSVLKLCIEHGQTVKVIYSKGNHDESMAWAFVQMLKAMFPQAEFNDTFDQRKCISWRNCFIGITHGHMKKSSMTDLRGQFTIQFPMQFAEATVREIHTGHLHHEEEKDIYGVMVRRLARNGTDDEWSDNEGFVGANKRFMIFRWKPGRLAGIDFI